MATEIAHISDIHFGAVDSRAAARLADELNENAPDAIIVTGDLTQAGRRSEYSAAGGYLRGLKPPTLTVPGNHDAPVYSLGVRFADPWRRFRKHIHTEIEPNLHINDVFVTGLNSARRARAAFDWSYGRLSSRQLDAAANVLRGAKDARLKIAAFHHPVIPAPGRAGQALINQPQRAMNALSGAGADIILTGHSHIAQTTLAPAANGGVIVLSAGTAMSTRLRGEAPSYNLLAWDENTLHVSIRRFKDGRYETESQARYLRIDGAWTAEPAA
ncbi:MAG: metallophosphoesterase [Pseudomonadota bacterium]